MDVINKFFLSTVLIFCIQIVYGIDLTYKEIETYITGAYNRGVNFNAGIAAAGGIELNKICKLRSGFSFGKSKDISDINAFISGKYSPFSELPLSFSLLYIYNNLLEYKTYVHSILPFISFNKSRAGISLGSNLRFSSFFEETAIFESMISFCGYFNFINNEILRIGISAGNINEFNARNFGTYSFFLNTVIRLNDKLFLLNDFELLQSGGDGFLFLVFLFNILCFTGCDFDLLGLFTSTDLDERLTEKDNFTYLAPRGGTELIVPDKNNYSFIVFTDTHIEDGDAWGLEKIAGVIKDEQIDFIVILGDITQKGDEGDIKKFIEIADTFGVPCYPVIGNHDIYFNNWTNWKNLIGSTNYKITGNGFNLYILDTANSFFGKQQLDWLESKIKSSNGKNFVFTHCTFFVNGPADMQQLMDTRERAKIISILQNKCDMVLMGHGHRRHINEAGNVKYIALEDFKSKKNYCIVTVKNSAVSYKFKNL